MERHVVRAANVAFENVSNVSNAPPLTVTVLLWDRRLCPYDNNTRLIRRKFRKEKCTYKVYSDRNESKLL